MSQPEMAAVHAALEAVVDPCSVAAGTPLSLRQMGLLREVTESDGVVHVRFGVTGPGCTFIGVLGQGVLDAVRGVPGVVDVQVSLDTASSWDESRMPADARNLLTAARQR